MCLIEEHCGGQKCYFFSICASTLFIVAGNINRSHTPTPFSKLLFLLHPHVTHVLSRTIKAAAGSQWVVKSEMKIICSLKTELSCKTKMEKKAAQCEPM